MVELPTRYYGTSSGWVWHGPRSGRRRDDRGALRRAPRGGREPGRRPASRGGWSVRPRDAPPAAVASGCRVVDARHV